jgi:hypothetical protein
MAYVQAHGDLLTQLGASKVEATDAFVVTATYTNNEKAVNAAALLKDTIWGAQLVVDNTSMTADAPTVTPSGIADLLRGVEGVKVAEVQAKGREPYSLISVSSPNSSTLTLLNDLVKQNPAPGIFVSIAESVAGPFEPTTEA